ncbi:Syntaxin-61 like [Actinidia chinensis var. chinensis]|uniref:Syntaxin-61 like n=1 Tax=Actinidia chinensis var. chinensis TaxID=1590841 RepID=A0A2R6QVZ1_ACTCC|nr:Syntaxin-61 like [Actinidia chinensis var. chinensis]
MASSFRQWESDPLFSAAEVVQDSADRMESLFRLLLHEQSLVQEDHPDPKLVKLIEFHRRDLATTLETAKWQLEDFEREVSLSSTMDKSHTRENVISRHKQFIVAIREQILNVEKSSGDKSVGDSWKTTPWVNLDEQDRNGLALFLSGENASEHVTNRDLEDSNMMRRFLDPTKASSLNDEIIEHDTGEIEKLNMNGFVHLNHNFDSGESKFSKVSSHYSAQMDLEVPSALRENAFDRHGEDGSWDLEANEDNCKSFFHKNKLRGYYSRINFFGPLGTLWSTYGGRANRSFTKRLKDGEEQRHLPSHNNVSHAAQGHSQKMSLALAYSYFQRLFLQLLARLMQCSWLGECRARYRRSAYFIQVSQSSVQLVSAILVTLIVLGILASLVA